MFPVPEGTLWCAIMRHVMGRVDSIHARCNNPEVRLGMEERITELELRYMQQEKTISDLNETVCRQELAIVRLERELDRMREQVLTMSPSINRTADEEEPPPHY